MKICIITLYNSYNYGSFLQAKALANILNNYGEVIFLDTKSRSIIIPAIKSIIKSIITFQIKRFYFELQKFFIFKNNKNMIKEIKLTNKQLNQSDFDVFIFGSDEIWNVNRSLISKYPIFWGKGITVGKRVSYAASINNATKENLIKNSIADHLKAFHKVSVRDDYSKKIIDEITNLNSEIVVDPTMLLNKNYYLSNIHNIKKNYIAIYWFTAKDAEHEIFIKQIKEAAKKLGKQLISVGHWIHWCDKSLLAKNPFDYYINADYVITNTFHGTAFAINLEKQFISFVNSNKVYSLLKQFELLDRNAVKMNTETICEVLQTPIDYNRVSILLENERKKSIQYLKNALS